MCVKTLDFSMIFVYKKITKHEGGTHDKKL